MFEVTPEEERQYRRDMAEMALSTPQRRLAEQQERVLDETKQKLHKLTISKKALEIRKWFLSLEFSDQDLFVQELMQDNSNKDWRTFLALREEAAQDETAREARNGEQARERGQSAEQIQEAVERTKRRHDGMVQSARKLWRMIRRGAPMNEALDRNSEEASIKCRHEWEQEHVEAVREKHVTSIPAARRRLALPGDGDEARVASAGRLYADGKSVREVGKMLGVTYHTARKLVLESGAEMRPVAGGHRAARPKSTKGESR